jgi:hypothetical protein
MTLPKVSQNILGHDTLNAESSSKMFAKNEKNKNET